MKVQDRTISLNAAKIGLTNSEKTKDIKVSDMRSVFKVLDELPPVTTQPCEDAISREKVLLIIDSFKDNYGSFNFGSLIDLAREVRRLTPVIPQQQWIPVSERLPEKNMISIFFYRIRLNKIGKKMNNIENWFYTRSW